jgi:hypothetical protein
LITELGKIRREINDLIYESQFLKDKSDKKSLVEYNKILLKLVEKQINFFGRLGLIGSDDCIQEMEEITYKLESYMGKSTQISTIDYYKKVRREVLWQLNQLTASKWDNGLEDR